MSVYLILRTEIYTYGLDKYASQFTMVSFNSSIGSTSTDPVILLLVNFWATGIL